MRTPPTWLLLVGILGLMVLTGFCAGGAFLVAQQVAIDFGDAGVQFGGSSSAWLASQPAPTRTPTLAPTEPTGPTNTPPPGVTLTPEPTVVEVTGTPDPYADIPELTDPRRITILLLGIDQREGFTTDNAYRSDTMILVSINPVTKQVGMLSIPRDLWVDIPGYLPNRVNTANFTGDLDNYPGGAGPALAAATIQQNFGIKVDKYIRVNFTVFETVVDTLAPEGVEICINEEIYDPTYPDEGFGTLEVRFSPGCQLLKAPQLLQYARTRKTQGGDFDRARRQQQVLKALQAQFLSVGGITTFIAQIPTLYNELSNSVVTNLTFDELLALGRLAGEISTDNITTAVIDTRQVDFGTSPENDQILLPRMGEIQQLIRDVFSPQPPPTLAELRERTDQEAATIVIYNNTQVAGLAARTQEWLIGKLTGIENAGLGNIPEPTSGPTLIRDYGSHPWTARYLARLLGLPDERIEPGRDGLIPDGVMIVVGEDLQPLLAGQASAPTATP